MKSVARFSRHVKDVYGRVDELAAVAEAVEEMLNSPGWAAIEGLLGAELGENDRVLDDPFAVLEQASYAGRHGYRAGLKGAREAAETLVVVAAERLAAARRQHEGEVPAGAGTGR